MTNTRMTAVARQALAQLGVAPTHLTEPRDVRRLIRKLRPVDPGVELIRLGPEADGGYLVPDDLEGIQYAFSPGVALECGFELALATRGIRTFLADFSVDRPPVEHPSLTFDKKYIGAVADASTMTLEEWKELRLPSYEGDLLMQMDIEGDEYEVLLSTPSSLLQKFRTIVIEFHALHLLWSRPVFQFYSRVFEKLIATHAVVHIHPNNCCPVVRIKDIEVPQIAEFTFLRSDRIVNGVARTTFPHPLDRDNTARPSVHLARCWYED